MYTNKNGIIIMSKIFIFDHLFSVVDDDVNAVFHKRIVNTQSQNMKLRKNTRTNKAVTAQYGRPVDVLPDSESESFL